MNTKNKLISTAIWAYLDKSISASFLFILAFIFSKSLSFEQYGYFIAASLIVNLLIITSRLGLDNYLVKKQETNEDLVSKVLLTVIITSCIVIFVIYLIYAIIDINDDYNFLFQIITVLSWNILSDNLVAVINSIFFRELNNYKVAKISLISWVVSFLLVLIALIYLNPLHALIFFSLSKSIIRAIISISYARINIRFINNLDYFTDFFCFGIPLVISKNLFYLTKKFPQIFCVYFLGPHELGLLSASLLIVDYINRLFTSTGQSIWIPILSKINRENPFRLNEIYFRVRKIQFSLALPIFVFIFAIRNELINYILPEKFLNIQQYLPYCLLVGVIISTNFLFIPLLISKSMTNISLYFSLFKLILSIIFFTTFASFSLTYIIYTLLIIETIYTINSGIFLSRLTMKRFYKQVKDLFPIFIQSFIAFIFVFSTKFIIKDLFSLILIFFAYIFVYLFSIYFIDKNLFIELKQLVKLFPNSLNNEIIKS